MNARTFSMNLQPLKPARGDEASGHIRIRCCVTRAHLPWNEAARAGWKADLQGQSFNAYYSPEGLVQLASRTPSP